MPTCFEQHRSVKPGAIELIVTGASARTIAGMAVLPFTVMKTRYEVNVLITHLVFIFYKKYMVIGLKGD